MWEEDDQVTDDIEEFTVSYAVAQNTELPSALTWDIINKD